MAYQIYEHVASAAGFSGESFDIAAGPANTDLINVLLGAGPLAASALVAGTTYRITSLGDTDFTLIGAASNTVGVQFTATGAGTGTGTAAEDSVLTSDAPLVLLSTGPLTSPTYLDISALEAEPVGDGGQALNGRFFFLSVQNTDAVNKLTVIASGTINGNSELVANTPGDYLFWHISGGDWIANILPKVSEGTATFKRVNFADSDWTNNEITIIQSGAPGAGEVGPHNLTAYPSYVVQIVNTDLTPDEIVTVETSFSASGDITLKKAGKAPAFSGTAVIVGSLD